MATELTNEFPLPKNAYTSFDAITLRNLIINRLNEQGVFTDQNYIGSNLAAIIDIVSYAFNSLIFYLNRTSTESSFSEAQLYENINRIVKLLDYKPIGYQTSTVTFRCSADNSSGAFGNNNSVCIIPRYTHISIGSVPFSFNEDISFSVLDQTFSKISELDNKKLLYQGLYREAPLHIASGDSNEIVTLNVANAKVDHFNIDVYVYEINQGRWVQYEELSTLYNSLASARAYEKRLNSNFLYEIMFGDGINGKQLQPGDKVAIYFLQSSGEQGIIGPGTLAQAQITRTVFNTDTFKSILADVKQDSQAIVLTNKMITKLFFDNQAGSTIPKDVEGPESIKKNSKANFKSQHRLVSLSDYDSFIETNFSNFIGAHKTYDNWDYSSIYLKYFNDIQVSPTRFRQLLFNQISYSDSCNFNNIYLCCVPRTSQGSSLKYLMPAQKERIISAIRPIKMLTTEITFVDPIFKAFTIGVKSANAELAISDDTLCRIELIKTPGINRYNQSIIGDAFSVFQQFFNPVIQKIGGLFDYSLLTSKLLAINGVSSIITRRLDTDETTNGLSFYVWNPVFPDLDKKTVIGNIMLNSFEVMYFPDLQNLTNKIFVVEKPYFNTR